MNKTAMCLTRGLVSACALAVASGGAMASIGNAYVFDMRGTREFFHMPLDASSRTFINSNMAFLTFAMDFSTDANTLYAIDNTTAATTLGTIDLTTGAFNPIAPITGAAAGLSPTDLCIGPTGAAFFSTGTTLYSIDVTTGVTTLIAPFTGIGPGGTGGLVIDLAIDVSGQMYAHDIASDALYRVDSSTGAGTLIGGHGLAANFAQGMDFDWATNTLYATIYTGGGTGQYVSWNTSTGAVTPIFVTTPWNMEMEIAIRNPIPAPGALALLGLGSLLALRRRR